MTSSAGVGNASAIILAGGRSSRMGTAKCLLPFDGEPLIAHRDGGARLNLMSLDLAKLAALRAHKLGCA